MKIIFDSNFLIDVARFRIDLDILNEICGKCEFTILSCVLSELKEIAKSKGKNGTFAKLALKNLKLKRFKILKVKEKNTDNAILRVSDENTIVATNDKELRKKLKEKGVKTIYIRAKKKIVMG